jgi:hypothetical protein
MHIALFFTIPLLICMAYFFMGSLPLLVLNHDTPLDSRFIRGFFRTYYIAVICTATVAALAYAWVSQLAWFAGMAAIAVLALVLRQTVLPHMDRLRARIESADAAAALEFRKVHILGMALNFVQLATVIWAMFHFVGR